MPDQITAYRIFIATPGGLEEERRLIHKLVNEYNEMDAIERGVLFIPVGWELTLPGRGRPQALINEDLKRCDYFVMILHDRWGSPPDPEGKATSGTEEEYNLALERVGDPDRPIRDLLVFFKAVDPNRMKDPGPQLQKVVDFREQLETEKKLLFSTYDALENLEGILRRGLAAWVREHEKASKALP